jgi:hypothetical protein
MKLKKIATEIFIMLLAVCLFSAPVLAVQQYAEPKVISISESEWRGSDMIPTNTPTYLKADCGYNGGWSMIIRSSYGTVGNYTDTIWEYTNLVPWRAGEFTRNYTYDNPQVNEIISINGVPWQIFTSPGVYDDRPMYADLIKAPGCPTMAEAIKHMMIDPEDQYSATRPQLPNGDKKMVSIYNNQTIAVLYTSSTATPKHLLSRPYSENGRMMVPLRGVVDYLGAEIGYDAVTSTITVKNTNKEIKLKIDEKTAYVNGTAKQLETAPTVKDGYTMVPLRFLSDELGFSVKWIGDIDPSVNRADIYN